MHGDFSQPKVAKIAKIAKVANGAMGMARDMRQEMRGVHGVQRLKRAGGGGALMDDAICTGDCVGGGVPDEPGVRDAHHAAKDGG